MGYHAFWSIHLVSTPCKQISWNYNHSILYSLISQCNHSLSLIYIAMHHTKLLLILFSLITTASFKLVNTVVNKSLLVNAELGTMWKNNPFLLHNESPDNFSVRLIVGTTRISVDYEYSPPLLACCLLVCRTCSHLWWLHLLHIFHAWVHIGSCLWPVFAQGSLVCQPWPASQRECHCSIYWTWWLGNPMMLMAH